MSSTFPMLNDVRLMNKASSALGMLLCIGMLIATAVFALRHPFFEIMRITVDGDAQHHNEVTLRANATSRLKGNFFNLNLKEARAVFEAAPWIRQAAVKREFPNRLRVTLEEHRSAGFWGVDSESRLINSFGEIFEANPGDADSQDLPRLLGPDDQAVQVLAMYRSLKILMSRIDVGIEELELSTRGSWRIQLDSGAVIELGRGSIDEVCARTEQFLATLTQIISTYQRKGFDSMESADLRHSAGYAIKLSGVSTTSISDSAAGNK